MTFSPSNSESPYLTNSQTYSDEEDQRLIQLTNRDRDIARYVNIRQIGIYDLNQNISGQQWFTLGNPQVKRNAFRKVFTFTSTGSITHNITGITQCMAYGEYTDGTNFYGLIYGSNTTIAGQVSFYVSPTAIVIAAGAGAPSITSGVVVLEYLLN
jgi:hypothetical protein